VADSVDGYESQTGSVDSLEGGGGGGGGGEVGGGGGGGGGGVGGGYCSFKPSVTWE